MHTSEFNLVIHGNGVVCVKANVEEGKCVLGINDGDELRLGRAELIALGNYLCNLAYEFETKKEKSNE